MDRNLIDLNSCYNFLDLLVTEKMISKSQLYYVFLIQVLNNYSSIYELLVAENIVSNECLIKILCKIRNNIEIDGLNCEVMQIINYNKTTCYTKQGYFEYIDSQGTRNFAINNLKILPKIYKLQLAANIRFMTFRNFHAALADNFSHLNLIKSKYYLDFISPTLTAKNIDYTRSVFGFLIMFFMMMISYCNCFNIINNFSYLIQNFLKSLLFSRSMCYIDQEHYSSNITTLPIYSILIPLYKEEEKIESILEFIDNFNYPQDKLDVKIIVEEDDYALITKISQYELPDYIIVIKVPATFPRTKPKALNYVTPFCKGKYLVIYDAEDRPEKDQLIKAVHSFNALPKIYACLQSRLNFYNSEENLLSRFLSIEYSSWFNYLLKGLSILNLPVTLGGTSNHFRVDVLKKNCWWDAYNVTEDADIGIRLYSNGYKVHMIDSYTLEEAPITIKGWLKQRARWIKGFIQTFFIFLNRNKKSSALTNKQIASVYIFVGISSYNFFCLPWLFLMIYKNSNATINYLWLFSSFFLFVILI